MNVRAFVVCVVCLGKVKLSRRSKVNVFVFDNNHVLLVAFVRLAHVNMCGIRCCHLLYSILFNKCIVDFVSKITESLFTFVYIEIVHSTSYNNHVLLVAFVRLADVNMCGKRCFHLFDTYNILGGTLQSRRNNDV